MLALIQPYGWLSWSQHTSTGLASMALLDQSSHRGGHIGPNRAIQGARLV